MNDTVSVGTASATALAEVARTKSLQLDAARERIAELETIIAIQETELDAKNKTIAEQRALLAQHRLDTADEATEPTENAQQALEGGE